MTGVNPAVNGWNGADNVRCNPIAARAPCTRSAFSVAASERWKLGATTMTDVALMRPCPTRSRIAVETDGEMP